MRFGLVGPAYPFRGGIAQYTASLYSALVTRHEVLLISFTRQYPSVLFPGMSQKDESRRPFRVPGEALIDSIGPASWKRAAQRMADFRPDAVIMQWWHPFFAPAFTAIGRRLKRRASSVVFFLCHNVLPHESPSVPGVGWVLERLTERAFVMADGFLAHSERLAEEVRRFNPSAPVIRIFHPVYDFYGAGRSETSEEPRVPKLLFFGNVRPYKGLEVFLRALALVQREMSCQAILAGEFYVHPKPYRRLAEQLKLDSCLEWRDHYIPNEEVASLFGQVDLVVLPYLEATQSGVVPLAYHFNVPVVASDVGGLSEVVLEGKTGYLVPPNRPDCLAEKILQYFRENRRPQFRAEIEAFKENLSWQGVVDTILELYAAVCFRSRT